MSINVTPIPRLIDLAVPAFTLGTANSAGAAPTAVSSNSTLLAFDTTVPTTIAYSASAAAGSATVAADFNFIVGDQLPDMKVLDFLTGIFKMFNLTAYYDELTEEIKVMPLDEFYSSSTTTHDITKYLDKNLKVG